MNLNIFMNNSILKMMNTARKFYQKNNGENFFVSNIIPNSYKKYKIRSKYAKEGVNIPPFLIASITSQCNLKCTGCYANHNKNDCQELTPSEWQKIFSEASQIGISFILLAGGEPLMVKSVIKKAALFPDIIFPIFTNGTMIDDEYLNMFEEKQNLTPIISIEGNMIETDKRRGTGIYNQTIEKMEALQKRNILYGVSITATSENYKTVTDKQFISDLASKSCSVVIFVEYVPMDSDTQHLALNDEETKILTAKVAGLKDRNNDMILIHFPGDEEKLGGCLASGRGFFHINSNGGAEPCPFSPYSKQNLREDSIIDILKSQYFVDLQEIAKNADHHGGCTLFKEEEKVKALNE